MPYLQSIIAYTILAIAVAFIVKKFFLPKSLFAAKKTKAKACGNDGCGCS